MINWARLPAGSSFRAHYHEDMEETFVILAGVAQMKVGPDQYELGRGDTLVVSPGEIHTMEARGSEDVEYIVVGISLGKQGRTIVVE